MFSIFYFTADTATTVAIANVVDTVAAATTAQEKAVSQNPQTLQIIPQLSLTDATEVFENGCKATSRSIKIVNLSGSWWEMGR